MRKNSFRGASASLGLNLEQLETILVEVIPIFCNDNELTSSVVGVYNGLSYRSRHEGHKLDGNELNEIMFTLSAFLRSSPTLPSFLVAQVHSFMGIIEDTLKMYRESIQSFTKAMWLYQRGSRSRSSFSSHPPSLNDIKSDPMHIAITAHRLGMVYGKDGDYDNAIQLLEKALSMYEDDVLDLRDDDELVQSATKALRTFGAISDIPTVVDIVITQPMLQQVGNHGRRGKSKSMMVRMPSLSSPFSERKRSKSIINKARGPWRSFKVISSNNNKQEQFQRENPLLSSRRKSYFN